MAGEPKDRGFELVGDPVEAEGQPGAHPREPLPPMGFSTLVLSLSTSALVHLGVAPAVGLEGEEARPDEPPNLALAQQTIDILAMLQEKTRGNLEPEEARLLETVLHDLRMRFVEVRDKRTR